MATSTYIREPKTPCDCYECVGAEYIYDEYGRHVKNNVKWHTLLNPCEKCGEPKTEYRDLGTKGYYVCWHCEDKVKFDL